MWLPMMSRHHLLLAFIYFVVLLLLLPILCSDKVYSLFYQYNPESVQQAESAKLQERLRGVREYLAQLNPNQSLAFHTARRHSPVDNLVLVLAKTPAHHKDLILTQLATEIDNNIRNEKGMYRSAFMICNASRTEFKELEQLSRYYPIRMALNTTQWKLFNTEEVLKHDFVDCVKQGLKYVEFKYLVMIRDKVIPYNGRFLSVVNHVTNNHLGPVCRDELRPPTTPSPWLFLHLHEPLAQRSYQVSLDSLKELVIVTGCGALLFRHVFNWLEVWMTPEQRRTYTIYGGVYFLTLAVVVGRPYLTELRRLAADLYRVYVPPEAVPLTAAVLPRTSLDPLLAELELVRCSIYAPFHRVLDHMMNTLQLPSYVLSPSLFRYMSTT